MRNLENELKKRTINYKKLTNCGFKRHENKYLYKTKILNEEFEVQIVLSADNQYSKVIDTENGTEYSLVDIEDAVGEFVGKVRQEYEKIIENILNNCTEKENFKTPQAKEIIEYIKQKYGDELEFLWEKFDNVAIWRNKQNEKWYGLLFAIQENKIKPGTEDIVEVIDLRYAKENIDKIIDNNLIFPGYHMNKKSWITIILDYSVNTKTICELIDNSYNLSLGNKCSKKNTNGNKN